jgi:predicted house-cleaning noncanonical NTP pyrophosphatase (MazG superfamily)
VKLIRDRIPEIMAANSQPCTHRLATLGEYRYWLHAKLVEETAEAIAAALPHANPAELVGELADVLEVVYQLADLSGITARDLEQARRAKRQVRGGFTRGVIWPGPDAAPKE